MDVRTLWVKTCYSSGVIKNILFRVSKENNEIKFQIPDMNLVENMPCRFKLIVEEVLNDEQLLLGTEMLGEKVFEKINYGIPVSFGDRLTYSHENMAIQSTIEQEILGTIDSFSKTNHTLNGEYNIQVQVFQKDPPVPQFLSSEAPPYLTDYEQKIKTCTVYILLFKSSCDINKNKELTNISVYGGLGHLGFFMADLSIFNEFIKKEIGNHPANLVELFTSTDLVDKCFERVY